MNTSQVLAKQTLKMDNTQINAKAKKAEDEWERLQESRKIKKISEDPTEETASSLEKTTSKETNTSKVTGKEKVKKDSFRDIA